MMMKKLILICVMYISSISLFAQSPCDLSNLTSAGCETFINLTDCDITVCVYAVVTCGANPPYWTTTGNCLTLSPNTGYCFPYYSCTSTEPDGCIVTSAVTITMSGSNETNTFYWNTAGGQTFKDAANNGYAGYFYQDCNGISHHPATGGTPYTIGFNGTEYVIY